ncbi:alpha/beta-hydrolase [Marasmius fiardii PR-910]|nr:alpha/beta-hydrolase [Marasmius fiardii PR-910]
MSSIVVLGLLALCGVVSTQPVKEPSTPVVDLGYARYSGAFNGSTNVTSFLGMRFAAAPIGELRWRAPQPPGNEYYKGIQEAIAQPPQCAQAMQGAADRNPFWSNNTSTGGGLVKRQSGGPAPTDTPISEDCLFINVQYPGAGTPKEKLPVLVYIHGGGYVLGGANLYDGSYLVEQSNQGALVVVFQYRLGVFGFLAGDEVQKNGQLNAGLLDQEYALRWVRKHISKFGGNPERVTLWGKSAGGGSVLQQVIANDGRTKPQLFRAAIASSPYLPAQYNYNDRIPTDLYKQVVDGVKCTNARDTLACLRSADTKSLQEVNTRINEAGFYGTFTFTPVVDGKFIVQRPTEAMKQGKVNGQRLYAVSNQHEGDMYVDNTTTPLSASEFAAQLFPNLDTQSMAEIDRLYNPLGAPLQQNSRILGEVTFICPTYYLMEAFKNSSYKAEFAVGEAGHLNDIPFCFPSAEALTPINFNDTDFIEAFAQSFMSFACHLNPDVNMTASIITPHWDAYQPNDVEMVFNKTLDNKPDIKSGTSNPGVLERCGFWQSISQISGQ